MDVIPKDDLEHLAYYRGACGRGPHVMQWDEEKGMFLYIRFKWTEHFVDEMHHLHDVIDKGLAGFRPLEKIEEPMLMYEDRYPVQKD